MKARGGCEMADGGTQNTACVTTVKKREVIQPRAKIRPKDI